jgi:nucleolar protein 56
MKTTVIACPFGILAFNEKNKLVDYVLFPKRPKKAAEIIHNLKAGKLVDEMTSLLEKLRKEGYKKIVFENAEIAQKAQEKFEITASTTKPSTVGEILRENMEEIAVKTGFVKEATQLADWIRKVTVELTKIKVKLAVEKRDLMVAQAIQTIDDLDKTINLFMGRLREWYGLHLPELNRLVEKHETYARLVLSLGERENFTLENLKKEGIPAKKAEKIAKAALASMGAELSAEDLEKIQTVCKTILELYSLRRILESYVDATMEEVAPNIKSIVGSLLGARLIAIAGGLENLAKMPASTIQVLGAEKALFRALKTGTKPPKHGIIFQHTFLHQAKKWQRGKIARAIAGKLAIAARTDAFGGKYIGDELKAGLEKRITEIHAKYSQPPTRPKKVEKAKRRRKKRRARRS